MTFLKKIFNKIQRSISKPSNLSPLARFMLIKSICSKVLTNQKLELNGIRLDVGCGKGYASLIFSKKFSEVVSLDVSKKEVETAKRNLRKANVKTHFVLADATKLPFREDSFNVVTGFSIIEHLQDQPTFLKDVNRVLTKRGIFMSQFPNDNFPLEFHTGIPFPGILPRKLKNLYVKHLLKWSSDFDIWNLTPKKAVKLCEPRFGRIYIEKCNYPEEVIPVNLSFIYRLAKKLRFLELCPMGWVLVCVNGK
jgi:ubiquinone/menaquinone biosynthesis C-methylase UbiE